MRIISSTMARGSLADRVAARRISVAPFLVAVLVMVFWGATPVVSKVAVEDIDPILVGTLRTVLAGLIVLPILAWTRLPLPPSRRHGALLAVSGLSGFVVFPIVFTIGQERTSAIHGGMILAALPVITGAYVMLLGRRRPGREWLLGCGIALAGELVLIAGRGEGTGNEASLAGDLLIAASVLVVAAGYVAGGRLGQLGYGSLATTLWGVAGSAVVVAPIVAGLVAANGWPSASADAWASVAFLAVITSVVGYIGWYWALARGGIARIATVQFLQPFSGLVLAAVVLGERFSALLIGASAAILAGVWIAQRP
jgi:drug/metabolite transporter (DMT)-like permease